MRLAQRTAEHSEVLAEDEDEPAIDRAIAGNDTIPWNLLLRHAEIRGPMLDEHVPLLEGAGIEQQIDPLARRQLALAMLRLAPLPAAAGACRDALPFELPQDLLHRCSDCYSFVTVP